MELNGSKTLRFGNNNFSHGMMAAVKAWWDESLGNVSAYGSDTGAVNAYAIAPAPSILAYVTGQSFYFFAANANTGAATLDVCGLGVKGIQRDGLALASGDIDAGDLVCVVYDGTQFQMPPVSAPLPLYPDNINSRLGIAEASPLTALHIKSSDSTVYDGAAIQVGDNTILLENSEVSQSSIYTQLLFRTKRNSVNNDARIVSVSDENGQTSLKFMVEDAGTPTEGLVIDNDANVDIPNGNMAIGGNTVLPIDQLTTLGSNSFDQTADSILLWDSSATAHKQVKLQDLGLTVISEAAAQTFAPGDANSLQSSTSATPVTWTIPPNASVAFEIGTVIQIFQSGAGQVTVAQGSGVTLRSPNGTKTSQQYGIACIVKVGTDEWVLYGDVTT